MTSDELRDAIALRLDVGWSLGQVERALIEPAARLSEDERAALWLFAWSYPPSGTRAPGRGPAEVAR